MIKAATLTECKQEVVDDKRKELITLVKQRNLVTKRQQDFCQYEIDTDPISKSVHSILIKMWTLHKRKDVKSTDKAYLSKIKDHLYKISDLLQSIKYDL